MTTARPRMHLCVAAALCAALAGPSPALAHPHVIVVARAAFVVEGGKVTGIRHRWTFDEAYSALATSGMKKGADGKTAEAELKDLAKLNVESLSEFGYFTNLKIGAREAEFRPPSEGYFLEDTGKALVLNFVLPLKTPVTPASNMSLKVDDETYFVAFSFDESAPASVEGTSACTTEVKRPAQSAQGMQKMGEDFFSNLKTGFTDQYATLIKLTCP